MSSSCGSIEREADCFEDMDELTTEERAMTTAQTPQQQCLRFETEVAC